MRGIFLFAVSIAIVCASLATPARQANAQLCNNDYVSLEIITGRILSIDPAPEPFQSADIFIAGPKPCDPLWMQALKKDVVQCRVGDTIEAKGYVTSDPDDNAWQINPERNDYMLIGADYKCERRKTD